MMAELTKSRGLNPPPLGGLLLGWGLLGGTHAVGVASPVGDGNRLTTRLRLQRDSIR